MPVTVTLPGVPNSKHGQDNTAALIYAALHFCAQPGTVDQFHSFMHRHLQVAVADVPPAGVLDYLAGQVWAGHADAAGWRNE
jgi:hypothetical protein